MLLVAAMQLLLSMADIVVSNMQKAVERVVLNAMLMCRYAFMQRVCGVCSWQNCTRCI